MMAPSDLLSSSQQLALTEIYEFQEDFVYEVKEEQ